MATVEQNAAKADTAGSNKIELTQDEAMNSTKDEAADLATQKAVEAAQKAAKAAQQAEADRQLRIRQVKGQYVMSSILLFD